jgi:hypothetical protein
LTIACVFEVVLRIAFLWSEAVEQAGECFRLELGEGLRFQRPAFPSTPPLSNRDAA